MLVHGLETINERTTIDSTGKNVRMNTNFGNSLQQMYDNYAANI
jgi:hypothetical protein